MGLMAKINETVRGNNVTYGTEAIMNVTYSYTG
jgi:hypothetical protein